MQKLTADFDCVHVWFQCKLEPWEGHLKSTENNIENLLPLWDLSKKSRHGKLLHRSVVTAPARRSKFCSLISSEALMCMWVGGSSEGIFPLMSMSFYSLSITWLWVQHNLWANKITTCWQLNVLVLLGQYVSVTFMKMLKLIKSTKHLLNV